MNVNIIRNLIAQQSKEDVRLADALEQIAKALEEIDKRLKALGG